MVLNGEERGLEKKVLELAVSMRMNLVQNGKTEVEEQSANLLYALHEYALAKGFKCGVYTKEMVDSYKTKKARIPGQQRLFPE